MVVGCTRTADDRKWLALAAPASLVGARRAEGSEGRIHEADRHCSLAAPEEGLPNLGVTASKCDTCTKQAKK